MSATSDRNDGDLAGAVPADCPLSSRDQTRNLVLYGMNKGLVYLAGPVLYVGLMDATLLRKIEFSDKVANLPASMYLWATPLPVLVAWLFPYVRLLRPVLIATYAVTAATGAAVVAVLLLPTLDWVLPVLVVRAGVLGCALGVVATYEWEMLGRGVAETRRGHALGLAFGVGPLLAVFGSLGSQLVLDGKVGSVAIPGIDFPGNFALLYAASVPAMALAAFLSSKFVVPAPPFEVTRKPFVPGVFGGFGEFIGYRLILIAVIANILVYSGGNAIISNVSLYAKEAIGESPDKYAGYQLTLRFGFKVGAGLLLGWLLTKTHPKAGLLLTGALCLAGVTWALAVPGEWYLLSFGILGAGELFGVYYPNYILSCSPKSKMRRNMAFASMITMPAGFAPVLYGFISDEVGRISDKRFGFQMSFLAAIGLLVATLVIVQLLLPARPRPREADMDESDRALEMTAKVEPGHGS